MVGKAYVKKLWKRALVGDGAAFRRLGILFLKGEVCRRDKKAARLCLQKAMEAGDEKGTGRKQSVYGNTERLYAFCK